MDQLLRSVTDKCDGLLSSEDVQNSKDGISLLEFKNEVLASYINNLAIIIAAQISRAQGTELQQVFDTAVKNSLTQRVTLEKGVKGLEAKISYQIDKALRAFKKFQELEERKLDDAADGSESASEEEATSYRPNLGQLQDQHSESEEESNKYTAPKIAKTTMFEESRRPSRRRRDFAMEEYVREQGDAPLAEPSIGTTIMDHGHGGMSTERDRRKEREVQEYEEANFVRLGSNSSKKQRREARQRQKDAYERNLFGEDWGFLDRDENGPKRKRQGSQKTRKKRRN